MSARDHRLEETAFPSDSHRSVGPDGGNKWPYSPGMSLRDYFAGQALAGVIMAQEVGGSVTKMQDVRDGVRAGGHEARTAYAYADAMLAERAK